MSYVLSSILYFLLQVKALPTVNVASLWNPPVWKAMWLMDKGAAMAAQTSLQLTLGLNSFSQLACHTKRYTLQLYMGMVGVQTPLPCLKTDQYFSSKGTKHLAEQLLLNSFTHWSGTPRNTLLYCRHVCACVRVCVCVIEGIQRPQELLPRWEWGEMRASRRCEVWGVCVCVCVVCIDSTLAWLFFLSPYFISFTVTPFFFLPYMQTRTHKHTHLVPIILLLAFPGVSCVPCVWGRAAKRETLRQIERKRFCLSCTLLFQALTCQFQLYLFGSKVWQCSSDPFIIVHILHSYLYCDASPALTVSAHSLSVRHFRRNLQNVRRPKPGWQTETLPSECWDPSLEKLGMLSNAGSLGFAEVRDKAANNRDIETKKQGTGTCGKGYWICAD